MSHSSNAAGGVRLVHNSGVTAAFVSSWLSKGRESQERADDVQK
jgi:hypothetical protein